MTQYYVFILVWMFDQLWINCKLTALQLSKFILTEKTGNKRHEEMPVHYIFFTNCSFAIQFKLHFLKFWCYKKKIRKISLSEESGWLLNLGQH